MRSALGDGLLFDDAIPGFGWKNFVDVSGKLLPGQLPAAK
jgi:hypothetical protein